MTGFKPKPLEDNPFRPGYGEKPPELAGRRHEQDLLGTRLRGLPKNGSRRGFAIYGPRGMGKTALLIWVEDECKRLSKPFGRRLSVIRTSAPEFLKSKAALLHALIAGPRIERIEAGAEGGVPGIARGNIKAAISVERKWANLKESLIRKCSKAAVVLLLDEAHAVNKIDCALYQEFLNIAQQVAEKAPFLLVLAGTPDLPGALSKAESTFIERAQELGIGLLDEAGAKAAIRKPLAGDGIVIDEDALSHAVRDGQCYPYFLQEWGQALWDAAMSQSKGHLTLQDAKDAGREAHAAKMKIYHKRHGEIAKTSMREAAAVAVARAFIGEQGLDESRLRERIKESLASLANPPADLHASAIEQLAALRNLGFVWVRPGEDIARPGIPSLMDYTHSKGGQEAPINTAPPKTPPT